MRATLAIVLGAALSACTACASTPATGEPPSTGQPPVARPSGGQSVVPGEYIVTLAASADAAQASQILSRFAPKRVQELGGGRFLVVLEKDPGIEAMRDLARQDDRIRAVQPNFVYGATQ